MYIHQLKQFEHFPLKKKKKLVFVTSVFLLHICLTCKQMFSSKLEFLQNTTKKSVHNLIFFEAFANAHFCLGSACLYPALQALCLHAEYMYFCDNLFSHFN